MEVYGAEPSPSVRVPWLGSRNSLAYFDKNNDDESSSAINSLEHHKIENWKYFKLWKLFKKLNQNFNSLKRKKATVKPGNPYWKGTLSTVDLLELTSLDQLLLILRTFFTFFYKTSYLNEEVNCTMRSRQVSIPWSNSHPFQIHFSN